MEAQSREPWKPAISNSSNKDRRRAGGIYLASQLRDLIQYEQARSDRSGDDLSLVVCDVGRLASGRSAVNAVIREMARSIRRTDHLGWYDDGRIGVLLPMTDAGGARRFLANLELNGYRESIAFSMHSYPDNWIGLSNEVQAAVAPEEMAFRQEVLRLEELADLIALRQENSQPIERRR